MDDDAPSERHLNIHFSPEIMAGVYANFANVSHSDYEFTVTFARVDHEVEDEEVPGVVVARVNLSPRFMKELHRRDGATTTRSGDPRGHQEPARVRRRRGRLEDRTRPAPVGRLRAVKVAVISDVHANLPALEAVLAAIDAERARRAVVPG